MASQSPQLDQVLKTFKAYFDNPSADQTKLSLSKKRELLEIVSLEITKLDKRTLMKYQPLIVQMIISLSSFGCGASILRSLFQILNFLYTNGDFTKMQSEFFEPCIPQIAGLDKKAAPNSHQKQNLSFLTSKLFKYLWPRCHTPPTKELLEAYFKLAKVAPEKQLKEAAYRAIKTVIKVNSSNFFQISQDIHRMIQKALSSTDKELYVKAPILSCQRAFIQGTLNFSSLHQYFEQTLAQSIKGLEDISPDVTEENIRIIYHLFQHRLNESQSQGDFKSGFRTYNHQQREAQQAQGKKQINKATYLDIPRTLGDIFSFISAIFLKIQGNNATLQAQQTSNNMRYAMSQVLGLLIDKNPIHLDAQDPESILTPLLLCCNFQQQVPQGKGSAVSQPIDQEVAIQQRETCIWLLNKILKQLYHNSDKSSQLLKQSLQCLAQRQIVGMQKDTLENFSGFCKNQKVTSLLNEQQTIVLLRVVGQIIYGVEDHLFLKGNFKSVKELIDPILPYIRDLSHAIRLYSLEILKTLGFRAKPWIHELVTIFLSLSTMSNADLTAMRQVPIFIHMSQGLLQARQGTAEYAFWDQLQTLNSQSLALSCLLSGVNHSLEGGVPLTLTNTAFNCAKTMILGSWKVEEDEEGGEGPTSSSMMSQDLGKMGDVQRREAGWVIMEGLIHLGTQWIGTRLSIIFKLFNSVFSKEMCTVNSADLRNPAYMETVLCEFRIKKAALSMLRYFLIKSQMLFNTQLWKVINNFLVNAVTFFINHDKDKKEVISAFRVHIADDDYKQVKSDLFECFLQLPQNSLYVSKYVHILHSVCEEIVSEDILVVPSVARTLIHYEDVDLGKEPTQISKNKSQDFETLKALPDQPVINESQLLPLLLRFEQNFSSTKRTQELSNIVRDNLLSNSIRLFAEIFASSSLNIKNKQQLIKHLVVHTTLTQSQPPSSSLSGKKGGSQNVPQVTEFKSRKMISIALAILGVVKSSCKQGVPVDAEIQQQIHLLLKNCEQNLSAYQELLVVLTKIQGELTVLIRAPGINNSPNSIDSIIKELESNVQLLGQAADVSWNRKAKVISVIANLFRYFDFETLLKPYADRLLKLMIFLGKDNHTLVREFYLHYCAQMTRRLSGDNLYPKFFASVFQTCFHQMLTDIKINEKVLSSIGRMICYQVKADPESINSGNIRGTIIIREMIELIFMPKNEEQMLEMPQSSQEVMVACCDIIKTCLILEIDVIQGREEKILKRLLSILNLPSDQQNNSSDIKLKIKCLEVLASFLYKGYLPGIQKLISLKSESYNQVFFGLLNLINSSQIIYPQSFVGEIKYLKRFGLDGAKKTLTSHDEYEKLINYGDTFYLDNEKALQQLSSAEREVAESVMLRQGAKTLYSLMFKMAVAASKNGIGEWVEMIKQIVQYKHTSPVQVYEETKKQGGDVDTSLSQYPKFSFSLTDKSRYFIVKVFKIFIQLYGSVDSQQNSVDLRKNLGQLVSLAFSIISDDSQKVKKGGFSLIITIVKLFKRTIERIRDEEEDEELTEDAHKKKIREFLENPLLLEQYEAQLFSIIRQHLSVELHEPKIILKNYKLIFYFLSSPICKDSTTIAKILGILTENIITPNGHLQLFNSCDMIHYEKIVSEVHFKKLILLSKLVMKSVGNEKCDFKYIETNPKKLSHKKIVPLSNLEERLPEKFQKEDKERVLDIFSFEIMKALINHVMIALQDCMLLTSLPKQALKNSIKDLTFIRGTSRSAYNQEIVEKATQYFIRFMTFVVDIEKRYKKPFNISDTHQMVLHTLITNILGTQIKKPDAENFKENIEPLQLYNTVQLKLFALSSLNRILQDGKLALSDLTEFDLYTQLLKNLSSYGVTELTTQVIFCLQHLLRISIETNITTDLTEQIFTISTQALLSIVSKSRLSNSPTLTLEDLDLLKVCFDSMQMIANIDQGQIRRQVQAIVLIRVPTIMNMIRNDDGLKALSLGFQKILEGAKNDNSQAILEQALIEVTQQVGCQEQVSRGTQHQIVCIVKILEVLNNHTQDLREVIVSRILNKQVVTQNPPLLLLFLKVISASIKNIKEPILYLLVHSGLLLAHELLTSINLLSETILSALQETLNFLLSCYTSLQASKDLAPTAKLALLHNLLVTTFTVLQARDTVPASLRNGQVQVIFSLFSADPLCFKALLQLTPDTNPIHALTQPERALIEKILREMSQQQQQQQQVQTRGAPVGSGNNQASNGSASGEMKQGGGSIQLTMSFGAKKK